MFKEGNAVKAQVTSSCLRAKNGTLHPHSTLCAHPPTKPSMGRGSAVVEFAKSSLHSQHKHLRWVQRKAVMGALKTHVSCEGSTGLKCRERRLTRPRGTHSSVFLSAIAAPEFKNARLENWSTGQSSAYSPVADISGP